MYKHHQVSLKNLVGYFNKNEEVIAIVFGGSVAKGTERPDSDLDAMVILTPRGYEEKKAENRLSETINGRCTYEGGYFDIKYMTKEYLKQAAKTMNFLTEHKIEQYADLVSRIEEMAAESGQAADALKNAEKRLAEMAVLIKNVSTYQKTKPVYDAYRKARNREKYRAGQEQAIILHEAAVRSLKAAGIAKLPNLAALQSEYEALQAQKEALYADYGKLKKKVREYDIIKQNIDSILQADRQPEREKETERG